MDEMYNNAPQESVTPKPVQKKKSRIKRYRAIARYSLLAALVFFILLIIFISRASIQSSRVKKLNKAYETYLTGDPTGLSDIQELAEKYTPAQIALELINGKETAEAEAAEAQAQIQTFGDAQSTDEETASTEEETVDQPSDEEIQEQVNAAVELWDAEFFSDGKAAFDELSKEDLLDFSPTSTEDSRDAILSYGAVCGMLELYERVSTTLSYNDLVLYMAEPSASSEGYDLSKPVFCYETSSGTYLCAYNESEHMYAYWCNNGNASATVAAATSGEKYDLLSAGTVVTIRNKIQSESQDAE